MELQRDIIKAFKTADEDQRLSLFLTHRDLRPEFTEVYMTELSRSKAAAANRVNGLQSDGLYQRFVDHCWSLLRCCRIAKQGGPS